METKYLKIGLILIIFIIIVFLLVKFFLQKSPLQPPPPPPEILSPEEVAIRYLSLEQQEDREEAKRYLASDLPKVKIFGENYEDLYRILWSQWKGPLPKYQIKNVQILENETKITIEVTTSKIETVGKEAESPIFFNFDPPRKVIFEIDLVKEGNYWKIIKIDLPDLVLERKLGEKVEIIENVFIKPIGIKEYLAKETKPAEGFKLLSLEVEYENKRNESLGFYFYSFGDWRLFDENNVSYKPIFDPSNPVEIPPPVPEMGPKETKRIDIFFEVPENVALKELIFQNPEKKIIFKID